MLDKMLHDMLRQHKKKYSNPQSRALDPRTVGNKHRLLDPAFFRPPPSFHFDPVLLLFMHPDGFLSFLFLHPDGFLPSLFLHPDSL